MAIRPNDISPLSLQVTHAFPAVLEKLALPAFDMSKIISTFVRHLAPADQVHRQYARLALYPCMVTHELLQA